MMSTERAEPGASTVGKRIAYLDFESFSQEYSACDSYFWL
jgi:hypothetical protein